MTSILVHTLTAYPASCLVRGLDGRPKSMGFGGVERGRISSAALKRAVRTSERFAADLEGHIGYRTSRYGGMVVDRLVQAGMPRDKAVEGTLVLFSGGKSDPKVAAAKAAKAAAKAAKAAKRGAGDAAPAPEAPEAGDAAAPDGDAASGGARLGKLRDRDTLQLEQLVYVSEQEVEAAAALVTRIAAGERPGDDEVKAVVGPTTQAVDIAAFGRMFAERGDLRMRAAVEVAHSFTVQRALMESDFYVANDDGKLPDEDVGAGFLGEQGFVTGLFYGFARIDVRQLVANLGGAASVPLAKRAVAGIVRGLLTVSPSGKSASFGTHARAGWAMVEVGGCGPRSLAAAYMRPVSGEDHHAEAVRRAEGLALGMDAQYGEEWRRASMDVIAGTGTLAGLLETADAAFPEG